MSHVLSTMNIGYWINKVDLLGVCSCYLTTDVYLHINIKLYTPNTTLLPLIPAACPLSVHSVMPSAHNLSKGAGLMFLLLMPELLM